VAAPPPTTYPPPIPPTITYAPPTVISVPKEIITLSLSSTEIKQGKTLKINGNGFTPNGKVRKDFSCERGQIFGFNTKADEKGNFFATLDTTGMPPGQCVVVAIDQETGRQGRATFEIMK